MINLWLRTDTGMVSLSLNWIDVQNLDFYHLLFLERHHLMWLAKSHSKDKALAIALKAHPEVLWYFKRLLPEAAEVFEDMTGSVSLDLSGEEIRRAEIEVMRSINDWMVYVVDPAIYLKVEKRSLQPAITKEIPYEFARFDTRFRAALKGVQPLLSSRPGVISIHDSVEVDLEVLSRSPVLF